MLDDRTRSPFLFQTTNPSGRSSNGFFKMALNWTMTDEAGLKPIPLPEEKTFLAVENCQMKLDFKTDGAQWEAKGTAFVTNQRVVFLRQPMLPPPSDTAHASAHLRSLNVPLSHLVDCRYMIPVFAGPYYEASVIPVAGGNLPEPVAGGPTVKGTLKIWFSEGGGSAFRDAVEEVRSLARGAQHGEQLPAYTARPMPGTPGGRESIAPSIAATGTSSLDERTTLGGDFPDRASSSSSRHTTADRPLSRATSQLSPEELEAARVALQHEEAEREAVRQQAEQRQDPPTMEQSTPPGPTQPYADHPPAYGLVSPVTTFVPSEERHEQVSSGSSAGSRRAAAMKLMNSVEGRDRLLQTIHGISLLIHHEFGSIRRPSAFGLYPVPHFLFFLFPRTTRRETLRRIYLGGELADNLRKMLLLVGWLQSVGARAAEAIHSRKGAPTRRDGYYSGREDGPSETSIPATSSSPASMQDSCEAAADILTVMGEAADVAAFLGGSSIVWRIVRRGRGQTGQRALRIRQRRGLERAALWFEMSALLLQFYLFWSMRRNTRRMLGRAHRETLLLTDRLVDADHTQGAAERLRTYSPAPHTLPGQQVQHTMEPSRHALQQAENRFQDLRHAMKQLRRELAIVVAEAMFAGYELVSPGRDKEGWEAWSALTAGVSGIYKTLRER